MKDRLNKAKNHVIKHRVKYVLGAAITVGAYIVTKRAQEWQAFAAAEGVTDAFAETVVTD